MQAEATAGHGDLYGTEQALEGLERVASLPRTDLDPQWTYFIGHAQIAAYRGVCYVRLAQGQAAETALRQALDNLPPSFIRDRCLYLTYLSAAYLLQHRPEAAATTATKALALTHAHSPRIMDRLERIHRDLAPWQQAPEVEELGDLLTTCRYG